jgi:general secretion pathway protein E
MKQMHLDIQSLGRSWQVELRDAPVTVGRQVGNVVELDDSQASRFHCVIELGPQGWQVRDLGSRNGTRLNGKPVKLHPLRHNDLVQIGSSTLRAVLRPELDEIVEDWNEEPADDPLSAALDPSRSPESSLERLADALPEQSIRLEDIVIRNARGQVAHARQGDNLGEAVVLLRMLLLVCFRTRASDIHIEPKADQYVVRIRVDGSMVDVAKLKRETGIRLASVVKVLADIDIAQKLVVQEGSFGVQVPDRRVDYRVSFTPSLHGQKGVIRVLDSSNSPRYLWDLGLPDGQFKVIDRVIKGDSGLILVCGPTGSGKTASLYATLRSIDSAERNVVTIEDPIEIQLEGITQLPVREDQGNTFPVLLRSVLRQDPDVVLVGEIRDAETARVAMQAAMTGHLVFSTLHARDTVGSVFRLIDLGIEPYLISSALSMVIAQRLVRVLCPACRLARRPNAEEVEKVQPMLAGKPLERVFGPRGCVKCLQTGFSGRRGVFEVLLINDDLRAVISKGNQPGEIWKALEDTNFRKLLQAGYSLVADGVTTLEEVERAVGF